MRSDIWGVRRMMLALADLPLLSRIVFRRGWVTPCWRPRILVTRLLVWPASKAMRTRSQVRRVAIPAICLAMTVSMMGRKSAPYCISTLAWRLRMRSAAPAEERLKPFEEAMRESSSLTSGETQTWTGTALRLSLSPFFERADFLLVACERVNLFTAAGCGEAARSQKLRSLSCLTPPKGRSMSVCGLWEL